MPRTTIKIGRSFAHALNEAIQADGYSQRRKSRWINEAIIGFCAGALGQKLWDLGAADELDGFEQRLTLSLSNEAEQALNHTVAAIRKTTPLEEGVRSAIVRTALRYRISDGHRAD